MTSSTPEPPSSESSTTLPPTEPPPTTAAGTGAGSTSIAVSDLAARLGVDEASIVVVDEQEVEWPDSSLGCPEPGMSYLQVITPGRLIILEASGARYEYHAGAGAPFLCTNS